MPVKQSDGKVIWSYPDKPTDILWFGKSVLPFQVVEAAVYPDGYGYVLLQIPMDTASVDGAGARYAGVKKYKPVPDDPGNLLDSTTRTYTYYGAITVVP